MLENRSAAPITFSIQPSPAPNTNKHDQPNKRHSAWLSSLPIGTFLLYTDGSKLDNGRVSSGAATYQITTTGPQHLQSQHCNLGTRCEVFDTELHTVCEGLYLLPDTPTTPATTIYICTDNQSAIQTLANNDKNHQFACDTLL
jgi:hypothetical protein